MADETGPPRSKYPPPKPPTPAANPPQARQAPPAGYGQQPQPGYPQQQRYPQQQGYAPQQPGYGPGVRAPAQPSAHWALSIISFICFFLIGLIAIYFSAQVGNRWRAGDVRGAEKASRMAQTWGIVGIVVFGLIVFLAVLGNTSGSSY